MTFPAHQKHLDALRRMQFAPPQEHARQQRRLVERLVRHAYVNVPFYRDRLACVFKNDDFFPEAWADIPPITRADFQNNAEALLATVVPAEVGERVTGSTSGSSGSPLKFYQSHAASIASQCHWERMLEAHAIDRSAHLASIRIDRAALYPDGRETVGWSIVENAARHSLLHIGTPVAAQAQWLLARAPRYLMTYPSNAAALAQHLLGSKAELRLAAVLGFGEEASDSQRETIARGLGCRLVNSYGATETGYLAFECPAGTGYHLAHEAVMVEVTNADGSMAPAGTLGRVLITSLYNYAMPFIRYAIGDYAIAAEGPCPCGRTLPRLASIAGRVRNVFTFADGSQRAPWGLRSVFLRHIGSTQMQIVQTTFDAIEVRYVPEPTAPPPDAALIDQAGRRHIHPDVAVRAVAVDAIPRLPSGKVEDCISLVTPALR